VAKHVTTHVGPSPSHGSVTKDPAANAQPLDTVVTLTAAPAAGHAFDHWEGDLSGTTNPASITLDDNKTVTAVFTAITYALTVSSGANGTAAKSPDAASHSHGDTVTVTATPNAGYLFDVWSGDLSGSTNPATVTIDANKTVTAAFTPITHTLTVSGTNGTVAKTPDAASYAQGDTVTVTATPNAGYLFESWSGGATGSTNPETITLDADKSVTASFVPDFVEDQDSGTQNEADDLTSGDLTATQQVGGQKHLHLEVPHYDQNATSSAAPDTYLRLGAAYPLADQGRATGDDMLDDVGVPTTATAYFKDDYRKQNSQTHPDTAYTRWDGVAKTPVTDPLDLTAQLRTRGGWRQHTDGNLISTTRGDRVDVIYGNYKMVVLGRMNATGSGSDATWGETYWESSGGHSRWATNTQGDMVLVRWNATHGRWRIYDETVKGDLIDRYQGIQEEIIESPRMVTMVGSPDAATTNIPGVSKDPHTQATADADGAPVKHYPAGYSGKWVNPGGRKKMRPDVTERVYAKNISETTKVTTSLATRPTEASDTATLTAMNVAGFTKGSTLDFDTQRPPVGAIVSNKSVATSADEKIFTTWGCVYDTLTVDSGVTIGDETGFAPAAAASSTADAVRVDHVNDQLFCFGKISSDITHISTSSGFGGWTFNFSLVGAAIEISFGTSLTIPNFAKGGNVFRRELGLSWAWNYEMSFALSLAVNIGVEMKFVMVQKIEADLAGGDDYCLLAAKFKVSDKEIAAVDNGAAAVEVEVQVSGQDS
jgi:uncharacterized repeat protein (TIGR02543 family)